FSNTYSAGMVASASSSNTQCPSGRCILSSASVARPTTPSSALSGWASIGAFSSKARLIGAGSIRVATLYGGASRHQIRKAVPSATRDQISSSQSPSSGYDEIILQSDAAGRGALMNEGNYAGF